MFNRPYINVKEVARLEGECINDWYVRTSDLLNKGAADVDVKAIGFPFIQMRINKMFARTFADELHRIGQVLGTHEIKVSFMITDMGSFSDDAYQQWAWILFNSEEEAVHARLLLEIHPEHLVSQHA